MRPVKFPYFQTSPENDLLMTLVLTPFWWVLGLNVFIYQAAVLLVFLKLLVVATHRGQPIALPHVSLWFGLLLISYLLSLVVNAPSQPTQRIYASLNNYSMFLMGFLIIIIVYNVSFAPFLSGLFKVCRILCAMTGGIALIFLLLWLSGEKALETKSLLGRLFPSFLENPFFHLLWTIRITASDWTLGNIARVSVYSHAHITTGGLMVALIPLMMAGYHLRKSKRIERITVFVLSLFPLIFSLSRAAVCSFLGAFFLVWMIEKGAKIYFAFLGFFLVILTSGYLYQGIEWLLNVREVSTIGRFLIYQDAFQTVLDHNPLLGLGVRLREGFTMMAVGSHSTYIGLLLMTGFVGLGLFVLFQLSVLGVWLAQKFYLKGPSQRLAWRYVGISYIASSGTLLTASVDAVPLIAYVYFLVVACLLAFNRQLSQDVAPVRG